MHKNEKRMGMRTFIKEISKDTRIKPEVVEVILYRAIDIMIEQLANDRDFAFRRIFASSSHTISGRKIPVNKSHLRPVSGVLDDYKVLKMKPSYVVRTLFKLQQERFADKPFIVNRDNWQAALKWALENKDFTTKVTPFEGKKDATPVFRKNPEVRKPFSTPVSNRQLDDEDDFNPFIDDED